MKKYILFIADTDWANVSTRLSVELNKYSTKYKSDVICIRPHPFKYELQHQINLSENKFSRDYIIDLIKKAELVIYCHELQDKKLFFIPSFLKLIEKKKKVIYHASYQFDNDTDNIKYLYQLFVPEIYHLGLETKRMMIIPGCPIQIANNIEKIITNRLLRQEIVISHACSRGGQAGLKRKGSDIIIRQMEKLQKTHKHVVFNYLPYQLREHGEIMRTKVETDIYIDQFNNEIGGFGVSSIESLGYGCIVLSSMNKIHADFREHFNKDGDFPIINISGKEDNMFEELDRLCSLPKDKLVEIMVNNIDWVRKNLTSRKYLDYYENVILNKIFAGDP